jgi:hypothetical protein
MVDEMALEQVSVPEFRLSLLQLLSHQSSMIYHRGLTQYAHLRPQYQIAPSPYTV